MDSKNDTPKYQALMTYVSFVASIVALCISVVFLSIIFSQGKTSCQYYQVHSTKSSSAGKSAQDPIPTRSTILPGEQQEILSHRNKRNVDENEPINEPGNYVNDPYSKGRTRGMERYRNVLINEPYFYRSLQEQLTYLHLRIRSLSNQVSRAKWVVKGPRGPPGLPGTAGVNGNNGVPGMDGLDGMPGKDGRPGKPGRTGSPGQKGDIGMRGEPGLRGGQGQKGELGIKGDKGTTGRIGLQGLPGIPGSRGRRGSPGIAGTDGHKGEKGSKGETVCLKTDVFGTTTSGCENEKRPVEAPKNGLIYYRWGRTSCPAGGATKVYTGQAAASEHMSQGSSSTMCIPNKPSMELEDYAEYAFIPEEEKQFLRELDNKSSNHSSSQVHGTHYFIPCVACHVKSRQTVIQIPGQISCPDRWFREYFGFLVQSQNNGKQTGVFCLDSTSSYLLQFKEYLTPLKVDCDSLPCPPYSPDKVLPCTVCSI